MSYRQWREEFIHIFTQEFPKARLDEALLLLRAATSEQRWNEIACSIDVGERETARLEKASDRRMERVQAICDKIGAKLVPNGDPRGDPFFILPPSGKTTDWGERGIGVPGRSLPARCFN